MARTRPCSERPVATGEGPALVHVTRPWREPVGRLALGHGAGGGVQAGDLLALRDAAVAAGWAVALVVQPWKVSGRRIASPPPRLDAAWLDVVPALAADHGGLGAAGPLVLGGRSAGARVACRTAQRLGAAAVCCLAFPLHPPGRPERSRASELSTGVPTLVVQGHRDPFGSPQEVEAVAPPEVTVLAVGGDHSLRVRPGETAQAAVSWLAEQLHVRPVFAEDDRDRPG